jgi:hypothetical protein
MDVFIDIFVEVLNNLNFSNGFRDIRKKTKSKFLRGVLYVVQGAGVLLFAVILAVVILLLSRLAGLLFGMFI